MKKITFKIACDLIFGIKDEYTRKVLFDDFSVAFKAAWSLPINFPGTVYWKGLRARSRIVYRILPILRQRKQELSDGKFTPTTNDVLCCMLASRDEIQQPLDDDLILDNFITLMIASHDTSAILMSFDNMEAF
ncbi:Taxadiene 5-alpha hydroxylase [Morus notabilis]|uniref:Taxadiene 5-alpha hydroxylase n=1 Tax=Morus notabilis TaxID=981085 RepID=W9SNZ1_9ROSA|nr:Taxadiene 5-alpha hydroxylase [Morus notabilis]